MKTKTRQSGLTLTEMIVVVSIVALFTVLGLPAIRALIRSVESGSSAKAMISAALSSGRAIAAREQHYAGVRFQHAYYKDDPDNSPLKAPQYMIFIVHDFNKTGLANGFRAVEGLQPIKLPDSVGVMDLRINVNEEIVSNGEIDTPAEVNDTTTFSIVFSPSGKLVIHGVRVSNRDGRTTTSKDDIFNTKSNVQDGIGMFLQDNSDEPSRNSFIIYDKTVFEKVDKDRRYDDYLEDLAKKEVIYINPYTGTMIEK